MTVQEKSSCLSMITGMSDMECAEGDGEIMKKLDEIAEKVRFERYDYLYEVAEDIFWVYYNVINKKEVLI